MRIASGTRLGEYEVVSLLGAGGMGEVYRVRDLRLRREVAIKVLGPALSNDAEMIARFRREAEAASALNHPHIVTVHGFGDAVLPDGSPCTYMVVELIEGRTLRAMIDDAATPRRELLRIGVQIAEGLAKAHAAGIVHRDLKPDNVMVSNDGYAKILDFGLAKLHAPSAGAPLDTTARIEPQTRAMMGTAGYMSPEQVRGRPADARSDLFSFGCILFECVSGRRAFTGGSSFDVLSAIVYEEPAPLGDDVPEPLARVIRRCLEKDPERRYQSARDVALDLNDAQNVTAAPRTRGNLTMVAVWLTLLLLGGGAYFLFRNREEPPAPAVQKNTIESIVVLPFGNVTGDAEMEYLSDGVTDALLNDLSRLSGLRVIARATAFRYRNTNTPLPAVARELNVDGIVTGQVRRQNAMLVIDAELVSAADGTRVWGEHYQRAASDILALEREIAADVANALRGRSAPARPATENRAAHDLYLKGRYFWNKRTAESLTKALALFNEATDADPTYARAYSGVADGYIGLMQGGAAPWRRSCDRALAAARRALELDESIAEAHTSLGYLYMCCELDLDASEAAFKRATTLNPNYAVAQHWYGLYLVNQGRASEGLPRMREAVRLDPFSTQIQANVAFALVHAGRHDEARRAVQEAIELDPNAPYPHHMRGYVALASGDAAAGVGAFRGVSPRFPVSLPFLAYAQARLGDAEGARATLREIDKQTSDAPRTPALRAGTVYLLGDRDAAFALLERAFASRDYWLSAIRISPPFEPLREDPRYHDLLKRIDAR